MIGEVILLTIIAGVFGVLVGSFVNLAVFRIRLTGLLQKTFQRDECVEPESLADFFPLASYFAVKDRCLRRKSVIAWEYPAVEFAMGILFAVLFLRAAFGIGTPDFVEASEWFFLFVRDAVIATLLVVVFVYDLKYSVILDRFSIPAILVALGMNVLLGADGLMLALGMVVIGSFFALQFLVSGGQWIGGGDIRIGLLIGVLFGLELGIVAVIVAYIFGAIGGLYLVGRRKRALHSHVPFGTFLSAAIIFTMLFGQSVLDWYLEFFV